MNQLLQLVANALKVPAASVSIETAMANSPRWDSLAHMDLILAIEEHFKINLDGDEIADMVSVAAIAATLERKGAVLK